MEAEDDEEVNDSNEGSDECRTDVWDGVGGDEGGGDEQLFQINRLQQHASSEKSFDRWVALVLQKSVICVLQLCSSRFGKNSFTIYTEICKCWPYN